MVTFVKAGAVVPYLLVTVTKEFSSTLGEEVELDRLPARMLSAVSASAAAVVVSTVPISRAPGHSLSPSSVTGEAVPSANGPSVVTGTAAAPSPAEKHKEAKHYTMCSSQQPA